MDDKEKEKFGVIIDKNDQDKNDQPKVESDNKNVETEQVQETNIKSNEEKQPEIDNINIFDGIKCEKHYFLVVLAICILLCSAGRPTLPHLGYIV